MYDKKKLYYEDVYKKNLLPGVGVSGEQERL